MTISIQLVDSDPRVLAAFLAVSDRVYRGDPHYCAPGRETVCAAVRDEAHADSQRAFVAIVGDRPVARVLARLSGSLTSEDGRPAGTLGLFEAVDDPAVVERLLATAVRWLRENGAGSILGPMDGDTWHRYRLNVGPRDLPPFLMEPYNPEYYPALWERNGFRVLERYHSKRVVDPSRVFPRLEAKYRTALEAGYRFDRIRTDRFDAELERLYALSVAIFRGNFLYSDISFAQFRDMYAGARRLIEPGLVRFAVAPDGSDAGFLFAFPDRFRAVSAMRGKRGLWSAVRFLVHRARARAVNLKSLGVLPDHRGAGLASALMYLGYHTAHALGFRDVNLCLILDGNPSGNIDAGFGTVFRRYHLYELAAEAAS